MNSFDSKDSVEIDTVYRIGVASLGGPDWIGGAELSKNIVLAGIKASRKLSDCATEVSLLGDDSFNLEGQHLLGGKGGKDQKAIEWPPPFEFHAPPFWRRIPKISRWILGQYPSYERQKKDAETRALLEGGVDFVYGMAEGPAPGIIGSAGWIPDFQHRELPGMFSQKELEARDKWVADSCDSQDLMVFSSEHAREGFSRFYPEFREAVETRVLPFRVSIDQGVFSAGHACIKSVYGLESGFFLVCNQFWKHKNHILILDALEIVKARGKKLIVAMTGKLYDYRHPTYIDEFLRDIHLRGLHDSVKLLGLIPKTDQLRLMTEAHAVIQPSLFEGWNTCVEECHALGCPILLSDIPVHREQQAPRSAYFEPNDAEALADLMMKGGAVSEKNPIDALDCYESLVDEFGNRFLRICGVIPQSK